jgi:hypothetical protein
MACINAGHFFKHQPQRKKSTKSILPDEYHISLQHSWIVLQENLYHEAGYISYIGGTLQNRP